MQAINWYLPQHGVRTKAILPDPFEVQEGRLYRIPFDFLQVAPNATGQNFIVPSQPFLIWAFTYSITGGSGAGFQYAFYHRHGSFERDLQPAMVLDNCTLGTRQYPAFLRSPYLIDTGEALGIELRSLEQADTVDIEIVAWGANLVHVPQGVVPA